MAIYKMKIREKFIELIKKGNKKREYRLATPERLEIKNGDYLVMVSNQNPNNYVRVQVKSITTYSNWDDALAAHWKEDFSELFSSIEDVKKECRKFYSEKEVREHGIIVFEFTVDLPKYEKCKVLFDTNIIIRRESSNNVDMEVIKLFRWVDKKWLIKYIHPETKRELENYEDYIIRETLIKKLSAYYVVKVNDFENEFYKEIIAQYKTDENSIVDNKMLLQVVNNTVDLLITDDKAILRKAQNLYLSDRVLSTKDFLNLMEENYPEGIEYNVLSIKKVEIGSLNIYDNFFNSLKEDYPGFDKWFKGKATDNAYIFEKENQLKAFLYLKIENETEDYSDIEPVFSRKKRLKVGTFKVESTGLRIGERFLKIIFDNALKNDVDEIYVTMFKDKRSEVLRLKELMSEWGFIEYGTKKSTGEIVLVKSMREYNDDESPKFNYPLTKRDAKYGFLPIYGQYHIRLFPDSKLSRGEIDNIEIECACSYATEKIYVTGWDHSSLKYEKGDILLIYRIGDSNWKQYSSVVTGTVIIQDIIEPRNIDEFMNICKNRTVFTNKELEYFYRIKKYTTIVKLLYLKVFEKKVLLQQLREYGIIGPYDGPRLKTVITYEKYRKVLDCGKEKK